MTERRLSYVCGFLFSPDGSRVLLIRKNRPAWQAGRLNGIGGKVEPGETIDEAMLREGFEEADVMPAWVHFITLRYLAADVSFFAAKGREIDAVRGKTDEPLQIIDVRSLLDHPHIDNLGFLLPMGLHAIFAAHIVAPIVTISLRN
ncbi:MAG: NUDIX domain-containing protein [Methylocystis sp.]